MDEPQLEHFLREQLVVPGDSIGTSIVLILSRLRRGEIVSANDTPPTVLNELHRLQLAQNRNGYLEFTDRGRMLL